MTKYRTRETLWLCLIALLALWMTPVATAEVIKNKAMTPGVHTCGKENCYWETPMDITDTEAVWRMLTQPATVIKGDQRKTVPLYSSPDEESFILGRVTCDSQGVHVLQTLPGGWTHIEVYSDIYYTEGEDEQWNILTTGYIQTELLEERETSDHYGIVVDKLTQRLYVFEDGVMLDELLVSTGLPTAKNPTTETTTGEFLLCSPVGSFVSDEGMVSLMAIRFNRGNLLHQIPYEVGDDGEKIYRLAQSQLGQRASNGCIRVQRIRTPNRINMAWIWKNIGKAMGTRIVIWEDYKGRTISTPDDDTPLYYMNKGTKVYHTHPNCYLLVGKLYTIHQGTYADLQSEALQPYTPCRYCNPPLRPETIEEINRNNAK